MRLTIVGGLEFSGWEVADLTVESVVVEPVDVAQGGEFDLLEGAPGSVAAGQLGVDEPDGRLGQAVVVAVADRADRRRRPDLGQPGGVAQGGVLAGGRRGGDRTEQEPQPPAERRLLARA